MFSKAYKHIGMLVIVLVLLGHHSFQAHAMDVSHRHYVNHSCVGHDCHHEMSMEICEKIQSDEMQIIESFLFVSENAFSPFVDTKTTCTFVSFESDDNRERIPLSYKQLARSHL